MAFLLVIVMAFGVLEMMEAGKGDFRLHLATAGGSVFGWMFMIGRPAMNRISVRADAERLGADFEQAVLQTSRRGRNAAADSPDDA